MADIITFTNLLAVLDEYGRAVEAQYKSDLATGGAVATSKLINSVHYLIETPTGTSFCVSLRLEEYWRYVEHGRKPGKFPPPDVLLRWVQIKPVVPRPDARGKIPSAKSLAFLIGRKIAREGIPPRSYLNGAATSVNEKYEQRIIEALDADLGEWVSVTITKQFERLG